MMDFNTLMVDTFIKELKCSSCNNYLSYFPIYLTNKDENICGRCEEPNENYSRNKVYEIMANEQKFPCRYIDNGCVEKLVPKNIKTHEDLCLYRLTDCPVSRFNLCKNKIRGCDAVKHCADMHPDLILRDGEFKIDLSQSQTTENILLKVNYVFLLETQFDSEKSQLSYRIFDFEIEEEKEDYWYRLTLEDLSTKGLSVVGRANMDSDTVDYKTIDLNIFKNQEEKFITCRICIKPETESSLSNNDMELEVLNTFKCSSCLTFNIPEENKCPSCKKDFLFEDNAAELAEKVPFPCKHQKNGCTRSYRPLKFTDHELFCLYQPSDCVVSESAKCKWSGLMRDLKTHITEDHSNLIVTSNIFRQKIKNQLSETAANFEKMYIIKMSKHLFLLNFVAREALYHWTVLQIGNYEETFCYKLKIFTQENNCLIVKKRCEPLTDAQGLATCHFTLKQLPKSEVTFSTMLTFELKIFKNSQ